ncbi:glutaminase A [Laceyella putida]|uniref:Glutaminase n=1 Tax=Laceyella putida TaxID=110101 RepID=A0ABW2RJX4_9BACL
MQQTLEQLIEACYSLTGEGNCAEYIPLLAEVNPKQLAIAIITHDHQVYQAGDYQALFTLQSISKIFALALAVMDQGEAKVFDRVGMEPTGDPFNSIYKMEIFSYEKPLNPMINAGAMVVTSMIKGRTAQEKVERLLALLREMTGNPKIDMVEEVYQSEMEHANRNRALAYYLKELGLIEDVEATLEAYIRQCAIQVTCEDMARMGLCLARYGVTDRGTPLIPTAISKMLKTFMVTCGMYNSSGEFAIKVGIPAKSGVSGGILAAVPNRMGIGVFGPALDRKGNSVAGVKLLEELSKRFDLSIF